MWTAIERVCSAVFLLIMVSVSSLQILVRHVPSDVFDFFWTEEFSRLLLVWFTFWGATVLQRSSDHISLSIFADVLPQAWQRLLHLLSDVLVIVVLTYLAWYGGAAAQLILDQQTVGLGITLAVFAYSVPVCSILMIFYTLNVMWRRIRGKPLEAAVPED